MEAIPMRYPRPEGRQQRGATPRRRAWLAVAFVAAALGSASTADAQLLTPAQSLAATSLAEQRQLDRILELTRRVHASTGRFASFSSSAQRLRDSLVAMARAQVGRRYRNGGETPEQGFDCSGLVRYVMAAIDVQLPRTAQQQSARGAAVERDASRLRPGDLLTFGSRKRVTHIGIYVGDGRFVHASSVAGRVIESAVDRAPAPRIKPWAGARRVLADADGSAETR
jgi:cell wall-associated NlpC family hydrolase